MIGDRYCDNFTYKNLVTQILLKSNTDCNGILHCVVLESNG